MKEKEVVNNTLKSNAFKIVISITLISSGENVWNERSERTILLLLILNKTYWINSDNDQRLFWMPWTRPLLLNIVIVILESMFPFPNTNHQLQTNHYHYQYQYQYHQYQYHYHYHHPNQRRRVAYYEFWKE